MGEMLSPHFSVSEFTYSDTARACGIVNKMNDLEKKMAVHTCTYLLEPLRTLLNGKYMVTGVKSVVIKITSGFRCKQLNDKVGSKDTSQHRKAEAADIEVRVVYTNGKVKVIPFTETYANIKQWCKEKKLKIDQCIQEQSGAAKWVHISLPPQIKDCRGQFLKYNGKIYALECIIK